MITLKAFGTLDLRQDDSRPLQAILTQPKRLALVVYLAVATPRGPHRRETLLAYLWPEMDETRARAGLNRAVHFVRQAIGEDVLQSQGQETLSLDSSRFWSDVAGFEEALDRGELAEALALYRGPLLPGFFVDEAPAFDHWLEGERARLQQRALQAARHLSETEEREGRLIPAIEFARRATTLAPQDEGALRRLMTLLEHGSDRAGALRAYDEFAKWIERELGVPPSADTRALAGAIRDRDPSRAGPSAPVAAPIASGPTPAVVAGKASPRRTKAALVATGAIVAAALLWAAKSYSGGPRSSAPREQTISVGEFNRANGASAALAGKFHESLRAALDSEPLLRVVDRGARLTLIAQIAMAGDRVVITAVLHDTADSTGGPGLVEGSPGETARLARDLAWQVAELSTTRGEVSSIASIGSRQTRSAEALGAFDAGDVAYAEGRFDDAINAYRRAVEVDSTFGRAYLRLSMAAHWENQSSLSGWAATMSLRHLASFSAVDQFRARAWNAYVGGRPFESERLFRLVLAAVPGDPDTWYTLGEVQFHWGPGLGWPLDEARRSFDQVIKYGRPTLGTHLHLARIAAMQGDAVRVDDQVKRARALKPDAEQSLELRALSAFAGATANRRDQDAVLSQIAAADDRIAQAQATLIAVGATEGDAAARAVETLRGSPRGATTRAAGEVLRAYLDLARGRWAAANQLPNLPPSRVAEFRAAFAALPFVTLPRDTIAAVRAALAAFPGDEKQGLALYEATLDMVPIRRHYLSGVLSARLGRSAEAMSYADSIDRRPFAGEFDSVFRSMTGALVRAHALQAEGKPAEALAALGEPKSSPDHVLPGLLSYQVADERFLRAELLRALNRDDEALRWYGTFPDPGGYDLPYLAPALKRRAEIAARRGDAAGAAALNARANRLWRGAEAQLLKIF